MTLTTRQQAQVGKAPQAKKAALRALFQQQGAANKPAKASQPQRAQGGRPRAQVNAKQPKQRRNENFLDPMCPAPAPTVTSDGKALALNGLESHDFRVDSVNTTILLATNTGSSGTVASVFQVDPDGTYVNGTNKMMTIPTLAEADNAGGATSSRAMKLSVSVINCSNGLKRGGRVTYLNSAQRLPTLKPDANSHWSYADLVAGVKACPYRRRLNGAELAHPTQIIAFPVDGTKYRAFEPHNGTLETHEFLACVMAAGTIITEPSARPMSSVVFIFDPVADPQDYSVTVRASYYTRWPLTSVPGQKMQTMPTADAKHINAVHDHAENMAHELVEVASGGVLGAVAPKVMGAARGLGRLAIADAPAALEMALPLLA